MPLREIPAINARYFSMEFVHPTAYTHPLFRLDAVQDIMNHPTFEASFTEIAKGLPDLERVVSRIHSKNCRVKDFLKVLSVCAAHL
jgi:DNA mismatch repair ATPase MutS